MSPCMISKDKNNKEKIERSVYKSSEVTLKKTQP